MLSAGDNHHHHDERSLAVHDEAAKPRVLTILSYVIEKLVARNDQLVASGGGQGKSLEVFDGACAPGISIGSYIERIYKYTGCSPSCFVVGYVYIDRLMHRYPHSLVASLNVHRLLVTTVMVASKMLDDIHYNNAFYAKVGGVSNAELNKLEIELLFLLDFGVTVSSRVFESYCQYLEKEMIPDMSIVDGKTPKNVDQRPPSVNVSNDDMMTEISVENTQTSSPPPDHLVYSI